MSLYDRHAAVLITAHAALMAGTPVVMEEDPNLSNEGWDTMVIRYLIQTANFTAENFAATYPIGAQLGARKWWIVGGSPRKIAPGLFTAEVNFKGYASEKPAVVRVGASADQASAANILAPAFVGDTTGAIFAKVETHENMPDISVSYLKDNVAIGQMTGQVGTNVTPPVSIDVPATVWDFLTTFVYHWPNGWILMGSAEDRLPGTTAALVTDTYKYIREKTPG